MKPICIKCKCFYRCTKSGIYFIEGMPKHSGALRGNRQPEGWAPYKLWSGDQFTCPDCGAQTIAGVGFNPISEHYKEDFITLVKDLNVTLQINDC